MKIKNNYNEILDSSREHDYDTSVFIDRVSMEANEVDGRIKYKLKVGDKNAKSPDYMLESIETNAYGIIYKWVKNNK